MKICHGSLLRLFFGRFSSFLNLITCVFSQGRPQTSYNGGKYGYGQYQEGQQYQENQASEVKHKGKRGHNKPKTAKGGRKAQPKKTQTQKETEPSADDGEWNLEALMGINKTADPEPVETPTEVTNPETSQPEESKQETIADSNSSLPNHVDQPPISDIPEDP